MSPQRTNLVLSTDIPHGEGDILVLDGLDVETYVDVLLDSVLFRVFKIPRRTHQWSG
jgi:hypothetical protein